MPTLVIASTRCSVAVRAGLGAFWLMCGSAFQATAHDDAHDAFMAPVLRRGLRWSSPVQVDPATRLPSPGNWASKWMQTAAGGV